MTGIAGDGPTEAATIRVLLVDDEAMVRVGLRMVLSAEPDVEVVGEAADGAAAETLARQLRPDLVLMDVRMPGVDGLEGARRVLAAVPTTRVVMLTTFDEDAYVEAALRAGVSGFLLKVAPPERLIDAVRTVAGGGGLLDPAVTLRVIGSFAAAPASRARPASALEGLTEREKDVLRLIARGMSNAEIAGELFLGEATVKTHVSGVLSKLGLRDRVQAVVAAYESGLVRPGDG
jgi:DNA-binding NarL/FixJ family response regulator